MHYELFDALRVKLAAGTILISTGLSYVTYGELDYASVYLMIKDCVTIPLIHKLVATFTVFTTRVGGF